MGARTQCSLCHKPIKGKEHKIPTPREHYAYGWSAKVTVCAKCAGKVRG